MSFTETERNLYLKELQAYQAARQTHDDLLIKYHLGRAHIIAQKSALKHLIVHCLMLGHALRKKNLSEVLGQLVRIALTLPAHLIKKIPIGNTGWSDVPLTQPAPLPKDLEIIHEEN